MCGCGGVVGSRTGGGSRGSEVGEGGEIILCQENIKIETFASFDKKTKTEKCKLPGRYLTNKTH